jgi:hypothetical protein
MSESADPELLSFAGELLEKRGGVVERLQDHLMALLPPDLAGTLDLSEETALGSEEVPLIYGSPLLDRLVALATGDIPVVYGQIEVPYLKKAGFGDLIGQDLVFADGQVRVGGRAEARTTYMVLTCRYVALSDERKEGLVQVGVHENSGAVVEGIEQLRSELQPRFFDPGKVPPHFPVRVEQSVSCGMEGARTLIERDLADFVNSMQRRLHRDVKNTREYYDALRKEMLTSLSQAGLTEAQRQERSSKMEDLPAEMQRKVEDLKQKYQVEVTITACAALRMLVNIVQIMLEMRFRKCERSIRAIWNPLTRRLDPLVCERCHSTIRRIHPFAGEAGIELLCFSCSQKPRSAKATV